MLKSYCVVPIDILYAPHLDIRRLRAGSDAEAVAKAMDDLGSETPFVLRDGERRVHTHWPVSPTGVVSHVGGSMRSTAATAT